MAGEREWLLVDTLGSAPSVVCVGRRQMAGLPELTTVLSRNASLRDLLAALGGIGDHVGEVRLVRGRKGQQLHIRPVALPDGQVHGAQVWIGKQGEQPPPRPLAGAWWWDVAKAESVEDEESFRTRAFPGGYRRHKAIAADLRMLVDPLDESTGLGFVLSGKPGEAYDSIWTHQSADAEYVRIRFSAHISVDADGGRHVRGVDTNVDIDPRSWQHPRPTMIARVVSLATRRKGEHCALMLDPEAFTLWRWWNDPPLWLGDAYQPQLHPEDRPVLLSLLAGLRGRADPGSGRNRAVLRLMGAGGEWLEAEVEADLAPLDMAYAEFGVSSNTVRNSVLLRFKLVEPDA
ncbi:GAF domain-containing protein [Segniliparus rugosus]|uniref:Rv3651-like N-terminal domain-containing protein n=1 Tax=Segniliparus rugosus (strain ATCC BAA-974 / DSM 45345 / CCUG 50838 / CIP 108380 / JCM 13579 / CDC 945) TaxID=679197 RepID=E5XSH0_SEGRC|nr:GAF domain-containing protein [Segniliparus rugosus]EFV12706.1 hypothetical protein HMPREF9336_02442 [Segniliparus rugosus ATCC BAA-974]